MNIYQFLGVTSSSLDLTFLIAKPNDNYMTEFFRPTKTLIHEYDKDIIRSYEVVYEED